MNKKSFTLLELIFVISIIAIITSQVTLKNNISKLKLAKQQIILHLKYLRYIAMIDNKYDNTDPLWFRERWTLKFLNCNKNIGGLYYVIYSDKNQNGHISKNETLKDPLTNNYLYSYQCKEDNLYDKNNLVLLTKKYGIKDIKISCNDTSSVGQISFDSSGEAYSRLSTKNNDIKKYRLKSNCIIEIYDKNSKEMIVINANTGFIE